MINFSSDEKVLKIISKIERPQLMNISFNGVINTLNNLLVLESLSVGVKQKILATILTLLSNNKVPEVYYNLVRIYLFMIKQRNNLNCLYLQLETCYTAANKETLTEKEHLAHLKVLYAKQNFQVLFDSLKSLPIEYLGIIDWECEIFIKFYVLRDDNYKNLLEQLKQVNEQLLTLNTKYTRLARIIIDILKEPSANPLEVKDALEDGNYIVIIYECALFLK